MSKAMNPVLASFVNFTTKTQPVQAQAFKTTRAGTDRTSSPVTIQAMHFDDATKSIKVFCSDGLTRECRVERLPSLAHGRNLWRKLQAFGAAGKEVSFTAAGGFSPDRWFYTAE